MKLAKIELTKSAVISNKIKTVLPVIVIVWIEFLMFYTQPLKQLNYKGGYMSNLSTVFYQCDL